MSALLRVEDLRVSFPAPGSPRRRSGAGVEPRLPILRGVDFQLAAGEALGLVGESGSGKSMTALALLGLLPAAGRIDGGRVWLDDLDLTTLSDDALRKIRGRRIALVFQEPMSALNPVYSVGRQIVEAIRLHRPIDRRRARDEAIELLDLVALPDAARRIDDYPHQLSGGQLQRVVLAMALAPRPEILLADEPTTALDVTVQAQILALLDDLRKRLDLAVLLITHDLGVVAQTCERVLVMYAGEVVEDAPSGVLFRRPAHPYTEALLAASPRLGRPAPRGRLPTIPGRVPAPGELPSGCSFHPRCTVAVSRCPEEAPPAFSKPNGEDRATRVRCWLRESTAADPLAADAVRADPAAAGDGAE